MGYCFGENGWNILVVWLNFGHSKAIPLHCETKMNNRIMTQYKLKTGKVGEAVVDGYKKIEKGVVDGYNAIEKGVVEGYKKIEKSFVERFLEQTGEDENGNQQPRDNDK